MVAHAAALPETAPVTTRAGGVDEPGREGRRRRRQLSTDDSPRKVVREDVCQPTTSSAGFHHQPGRHLAGSEEGLGREGKSLLASCQGAEVPGIEVVGHDGPVEVTGWLPGATRAEAVSRGTADPARLPDAVVRRGDATVALPLPTHYVCVRRDRRPLRRPYGRREELVEKLGEAHRRATGPPEEPEGDGGVPDRHR